MEIALLFIQYTLLNEDIENFKDSLPVKEVVTEKTNTLPLNPYMEEFREKMKHENPNQYAIYEYLSPNLLEGTKYYLPTGLFYFILLPQICMTTFRLLSYGTKNFKLNKEIAARVELFRTNPTAFSIQNQNRVRIDTLIMISFAPLYYFVRYKYLVNAKDNK